MTTTLTQVTPFCYNKRTPTMQLTELTELTEGALREEGLASFKSNSLSGSALADTNTMNTKMTASAPVKPKLHILLVTETWLPEVNGVAMSLHQLMRQLVLLGHQVSLLSPKPTKTTQKNTETNAQYAATHDSGDDDSVNNHNSQSSQSSHSSHGKHKHSKHKYDTSIAANAILTHKIEVQGWAIPRYADLQFGLPDYPRIKHTLEQIHPDIVHIATEGPLGLAALIAAKRQHIPATTGYHTQFHDFSRHFGLGIIARPMMAYFKWFHNASKATCVPSLKTQNDLQALGFKRLVEVGRGVDLETFSPSHRSDALRQQWGAQEQYTVLTMVSRLSPEKSVDLVIEAFKALQSAQLHRAIKLVIVGDGPDRSRLEALAADSGDDIIFTGAKTGVELAEHYASGDAFIFASQVETFGNVVTEAMASGLPVYAFDDAAAGMLVTQDSGRLAPMGSKHDFINMVADLPKMQVLKEQGVQARQQVGGFSWQRPAKQMLAMFQKVIAAVTIV